MSLSGVSCGVLKYTRGIEHTTFENGSEHLIFYHLTVVLSVEKGAYPENVHILYCHIKLAFLLTWWHKCEFSLQTMELAHADLAKKAIFGINILLF